MPMCYNDLLGVLAASILSESHIVLDAGLCYKSNKKRMGTKGCFAYPVKFVVDVFQPACTALPVTQSADSPSLPWSQEKLNVAPTPVTAPSPRKMLNLASSIPLHFRYAVMSGPKDMTVR